MEKRFLCRSCGVDWNNNVYTENCKECGGGAMNRECFICDGKCGNIWKRAVMDSHDSGIAHWIGCCGLPHSEQTK